MNDSTRLPPAARQCNRLVMISFGRLLDANLSPRARTITYMAMSLDTPGIVLLLIDDRSERRQLSVEKER